MIIPILLALFLSIIHFFFESYAHHLKKIDFSFISFSSGLFITYIFLSLFPELLTGHSLLGTNVFFIALWGFILFHILEQYVFKYIEDDRNKLKGIIGVRTSAFFINHVVLGLALVFFFKTGKITLGYFSIVPIFSHILSSSLIIEHLHHRVRETLLGRIISSGSLLLGAIIGSIAIIPGPIYYGLFAFMTGVLLYIIIRDTMPTFKQGTPKYFLTGVILYILLLFVESIIV
ncbi:hypothetical protein HOK51_06115 [Candidatus Woesearchaeota archaeon]|jgi:hypothetical protein|nr:hypothetical protein [Candidatus Woesearchaeota archaeon]MBT6519400.1 hypothetical protein [Candidatus Woesearchaeota archaeon]MBT7368072.1 hypothetical protein [Candidatus Woesearchaeota archaeon]